MRNILCIFLQNNKKFLIVFCSIFLCLSLSAQTDDYFRGRSTSKTDSIPYSRDYIFNEGVFLTIDQFKGNKPIPTSAIISGIPKSFDFLTQVLDQKQFIYKDSAGAEQKMETKDVWGYCMSQTVFINYNYGHSIIGASKRFNRVGVIGTVCHFNVIILINPGLGWSSRQERALQYIFDTQTNKTKDFNTTNLESILKNDAKLYKEFTNLGYQKKKRSIFIYLQKYNEAHPLYLPVK
ncbi:MAG: hypothetical protein ACT4ON_11895 [Bacteroidota bacterium]